MSVEMASEFQPLPGPSKLPIITVVARIVTLISLLVSFVIMRSNHFSNEIIDSLGIGSRYQDVQSYRYMLCTIVVGLAYTLLQTPFAAYHAIRRKRLINHYGLLIFDYYGDKVISYVVLSGVAAAIGFTMDSKKNIDGLDNFLQENGYKTLSGGRQKLDAFYTRAFISGGFLLLGFISSGVSSILSFWPLSKM